MLILKTRGGGKEKKTLWESLIARNDFVYRVEKSYTTEETQALEGNEID